MHHFTASIKEKFPQIPQHGTTNFTLNFTYGGRVLKQNTMQIMLIIISVLATSCAVKSGISEATNIMKAIAKKLVKIVIIEKRKQRLA